MLASPTLSPEDLGAVKRNIAQVRVAMLTTQGPDGQLRARPMATHQIDEDGTMWFFTRDTSQKVAHIRQYPAVGLSFSDAQTHISVSTSGHAQVVTDQGKVDELWDDTLLDWFPEGKDDPTIVLLKVSTLNGECWE